MPSFAEAQAANASVALAFRPVALFLGGTSGIGRASVEGFARYTGGRAHIIIAGRNKATANAIIASFPKHAESKYEFLHCDVFMLKNVVEACKVLKEDLGVQKLNYLFMTTGYLALFEKYTDNGEGIDRKLAVHLYSRFKFVDELLPLLLAAKSQGEEARVVSVLTAGHGAPADLDDLGVKNTYNFNKSRSQYITYTSLVLEELAERYPNLSFTHIDPGHVFTPLINPVWILRILKPLLAYLSTTAETCAEFMLRPVFDETYARGAFHLNDHAEPCPTEVLYLGQPQQSVVYEHVIGMIRNI